VKNANPNVGIVATSNTVVQSSTAPKYGSKSVSYSKKQIHWFLILCFVFLKAVAMEMTM